MTTSSGLLCYLNMRVICWQPWSWACSPEALIQKFLKEIPYLGKWHSMMIPAHSPMTRMLFTRSCNQVRQDYPAHAKSVNFAQTPSCTSPRAILASLPPILAAPGVPSSPSYIPVSRFPRLTPSLDYPLLPNLPPPQIYLLWQAGDGGKPLHMHLE